MFIDFDRSFINWETSCGSQGRFNGEAYLKYNNQEWLLGSPVMAGNVYGKNEIFKDPAYSFQPLFCNTAYKIFRTYAGSNRTDDSSSENTMHFKSYSVAKNELSSFYEWDLNVSYDHLYRYQAKVIYDDVELQFPIKHLNIKRETSEFHIETGTIAMPYRSEILTAFISFNSYNKCEVLINGSTNNILNSKSLVIQNCEIKILKIK